MNKFKLPSLVIVLALLAGCGGGSSSSGGGAAPSPTFFKATYTGTYKTTVYSGGITVNVDTEAKKAIVQFTGIKCLSEAFEIGSPSVESGTVRVSGEIPGKTNTELNIPGAVVLSFPENGGEGSLSLDPGSPCISTVGSVNVSRSN